MHLLSLKEWDKDVIEEVVDKAIYIKTNQKEFYNILYMRSMAMLFQKTSTRTRVSFEVGIGQLGGQALYIDWRTSNFTLSDLKDEVRYLSRNVNIILARLLSYDDLTILGKYSIVPVINGCCDKFHPCQIISDLVTIKEKFNRLSGVTLVYVGIHNNVTNSLVLAAHKVGINLVLVTPDINKPCIDDEVMELVKSSTSISVSNNLRESLKNADIVYTDSWVDMEFFNDSKFEKEKKRRIDLMTPYQLNEDNLRGANVLVMHDMPIHEGYEISRSVIESERSIIFDQR